MNIHVDTNVAPATITVQPHTTMSHVQSDRLYLHNLGRILDELDVEPEDALAIADTCTEMRVRIVYIAYHNDGIHIDTSSVYITA